MQRILRSPRSCLLAYAAGAGLLLASCGLKVVGSATQGEDAGVAAPPSESEAGAEEATTPRSACAPLEPGWSPVAYAASRVTACPADYVSTDLVLRPAKDDALCTCGCAISTQDPPSCAQGTVQGRTGTTSTCSGSDVSYSVHGTGCHDLGSGSYWMGAFARHDLLPAHLGTCAPSADKHAAAVVDVRLCAPPPASEGEWCVGGMPAGFEGCIVHEGDVACPVGPFTDKLLVATTVGFDCGGCETCENAVTCPATATFRYYDDPQCQTEVASRVVDGACNGLLSGQVGASVSHFRYVTAEAATSCKTTSSPRVSVDVQGPRTLCCR